MTRTTVLIPLLLPAIAAAASPEVRGTWVTTTGITSSTSHVYSLAATTSSFQQLRAVGLNSIYMDAWRAGYTYYSSPTLQSVLGVDRSPDLKNGRDLLQETVIQAHRNGMAVIPWFQYGFATYFGNPGTSASPLANYMKNNGWLLQDSAGNYTNSSNKFSWMNPLVPQVQDFVIGLVTDAVKQYDLDGIQFDDRLAWPVQFGYDTYTKNAYKAETGRDLPASYSDPAFMSWRASKITAFATRLQTAVKAINPSAIVSVAPSVYPFGYTDYLANYPAWSAAGLFDEFIPQVYRRNATDFDGSWDGVGSITTAGQVQFMGPRADDFRAGIAIDGSGWTPPYSPDGIKEEIDQVRATPNVGGEVFWYSNGILNTYKSELTAYYNVAQSGQAPRPDQPADYRPTSTIASLSSANKWTATAPAAGLYSVIAYNGTAWTIFDTRYLTPGSFTFPITGVTQVELIADHRPASLFATTSWNLDANAPTNSAASWSFNQVPTATALKFGYVITSPRTVTLDAPLSATTLTFDNANRYTLAGTGTLTLSSSITVLQGSHKISSPLACSSPISLSISAGASLDITGNPLLLAGSTSLSTLRQYLRTSQLFSSTADSLHALAYLLNPDSSITVQTTYIGDANLDGQVDADDYALLDRGFARHLTNWSDGDFNYDGTITAADYLLIDRTVGQSQGFSPGFLSQRESQFGADYVSQLLISVPEPSSAACLFAALLPLLAPRRRQYSSGITAQRMM